MHPRILDWFKTRGQAPFDFQRRTWAAHAAGRSGLVHAPTGTGKTLAVWLGPVSAWLQEHEATRTPPPLTVLWVTPLRALASDTAQALQTPLSDLGIPWTVELRTGDVSSTTKSRQRQRPPSALVTTPESLSVLLSYEGAAATFAHLQAVIVDEWHELMGSKRGVQTELGLARLRHFRPNLQTWGISATLGNLEQARDVLLGSASRDGVLISAANDKRTVIDTLIPPQIERFPWAGHLGVKLVDAAAAAIEQARTTLLFTNTRSQAELWYQALLRVRPDWLTSVALHHGSLDRDVRSEVEAKLAAGELRCVVCTSSLDLGVDFRPVEQVLQVGSPKGVARLMQRAGRSGHQPGATSRVLGVPTFAMELVEFAAARDAAEAGRIEARAPLTLTLDVLAQHLVTVAMGGGFTAADMLAEVRSTHAFAGLTDEQWGWCLDFVRRGGSALRAYPQFARVVEQEDGRLVVASPRIAKFHRLGIGTITSDAQVQVRFMNGRTLGGVEESFITRLRRGDRFVFAGQLLQLVQFREMSAFVRKASGSKATAPRWNGGRAPLSTKLAEAVRARLDAARRGIYDGAEMHAARPLLELQKQASMLPAPHELLIEEVADRDGHHRFLYPFAGRAANEGLGALLAHRLTLQLPRSVVVTANDYGLELLCPDPLGLDEPTWRALLSLDGLADDLLACVGGSALARRQFRDIARVAGLILPSFPGQPRPARHLQASSELFFDVFSEFDPGNMLLDQARREVMDKQLEVARVRAVLEMIAGQTLRRVALPRLSPLGFPLWADRLRQQHVSTEDWTRRVERAAAKLEAEAAKAPVATRKRKGVRDDEAVAAG